jgi:signal transduction histidine kinase
VTAAVFWSPRRAWESGTSLVAAVLAVAPCASADGPPSVPIADCLREMLDPADTQRARLVRVQGVLTFVHANNSGCVIQDDSAGMYVALEAARSAGLWRGQDAAAGPLRVGQLVEVDGELRPGGFSPNIEPLAIRQLGEGPLPTPRPFDPARFFSGADNCLRMVAEGILERVQRTAREYVLHLAHGERRFTATLPAKEAADLRAWVDGRLRLTGVQTAVFNTRGEIVAARLRMNTAADAVLVDPPPCPAWEAPLVPLASVARYRPDPPSGHRLRTRGTVTLCVPGSHLYLQEGRTGLRVETVSKQAFAPGDEVEAAGFVATGGAVAGIVAAEVRTLRSGRPMPAIAVAPADVLRVNGEATYRGQMASPGDYHGALVRFPARVIDVSATSRGGEVLLESGGVGVTLFCEPGVFADIRPIRRGSDVMVTGIVTLVGDRDRPPSFLGDPRPSDRLGLLLPSAADLRLIRAPSWWTARRLAAALAVVGAAATLAFGWILLLRRQVSRQLAVIEEKIQQEAVAEERRRIAREFHDSLEQDLAGLALRIDSAAGAVADPESRRMMERQREILARLQEETRQYVWDLREPSRLQGTLAERAARMLGELQHLNDTPIVFSSSGPLPDVPPETSHHLLRMLRESVNNAAHHAHAASINVTLHADQGGLVASVADDGNGFAADDTGPSPGHFGLRGLVERARRIGAETSIDSRPGGGTTVTIRLPCST